MSTTANKTLILAEHDGRSLSEGVYHAVAAAAFWNQPVELLVLGHDANSIAQAAATIQGVSRVIYSDSTAFAHTLAEDAAKLISQLGRDYSVILAAHSAFSRNILPRAAALLDVAMISDVLEIQANQTYVRAVYAGNIYTTVQSSDTLQILTIHSSRFPQAARTQAPAEIDTIAALPATPASRWVSEFRSQSERPPLSSAKVVISGGRSLGSAEHFEQILAPLASKLGAALGATRAAVDAGFAPNDIQVGQTGVTVAPELYIAVGVSGAVQHTYGMKDSKVVVAINQDPDAPIFQVADYGLVGDLFEVVPSLTASIQSQP
ncbi:electron transfer flavoprotein, alpha subunit [Methylophilaceae bacterium 11]|nr:electron transfer flavoprotein, alpha subunit [Methylophilaceae bacterium 11]